MAPTVNTMPKTRYAVETSLGLKPRIKNWARLGTPVARYGPTLNQAPSTALAASHAGAKRMMRRFNIRDSRLRCDSLTFGTQARSPTNRNGTRARTYVA